MRYHSAVLITDNVEKLKGFYTQVMKLAVHLDFGRCLTFEGGLTVWQPKADGVAARGGMRAGKNNGLELCFETEQFEADAAMIMAFGVKLMHGIAQEAWGQRTIRFFDPDGNLIELGESIPCFCRRLHSQGLSPEEVSQKTGVFIDIVKTYILS